MSYLTLTLKSDPELSKVIDVLYSSGKGLRKNRYWSDRVSGGVFRLDMRHTGGTWCVHFDFIVELKDQKSLVERDIQNLWYDLSGSDNVKVQTVGSTPADRKKLVEYAMKPPFGRFHDDQQAMEIYASVTRKRKKVQRFGTWVNTAKHKGRWKR